MNAVLQTHHHYAAEFERNVAELPGAGADWLAELRRGAIDRFAAHGFPGPRDENWKYTRTAPIERRNFTCRSAAGEPLGVDQIQDVLLPNAYQLVFVNGVYRAELSNVSDMPAGVTLSSLAAVLQASPATLEGLLNRHVDQDRHPFAALNTAFVGEGAFIALAANTMLERPIQLLFVTTAAQDGHAAHPRVVVSAGDNSEATLVETHVGLGEAVSFTNLLTEVTLGRNAGLEYYRLQEESVKAFHISAVHVSQEADSRFVSTAISLGAVLSRHDIDVRLAVRGAQCSLNGLYMAAGRQHVDTHTRIDHMAPHCSSSEFYKGVLDGHGRGVFNGKVMVHPHAIKTDARQQNQNLLLSLDAEADTKPELEIYNDDVKCAHGATVGQLDADAVFYLRSRGLDETASRGLLTYAFAAEIINAIKLDAVREHLRAVVLARLPEGEHIKELV